MNFVNSREYGRRTPATSLPLLMALGCMATLPFASAARAQELGRSYEAEAVAQSAKAPQAAGDDLKFTADQLLYDNDRDVVTAEGNVLASRDGNVLRADMVTWDRKSGKVLAKGDVSITDPKGNIAYENKGCIHCNPVDAGSSRLFADPKLFGARKRRK